jgi:hypothetical protein
MTSPFLMEIPMANGMQRWKCVANILIATVIPAAAVFCVFEIMVLSSFAGRARVSFPFTQC